jgi:microsomal epoxide hydrolase
MRAPPSPCAHRRALLRVAAAGLAVAAGTAPGGPARAAPRAATPDAQAAVRRTGIVTSDGVRLSLLESAPQGAPAPAGATTVVLVPGWCMPASIWSAQLSALGARWRTLALDPRGQGESEVPASGYTSDRRADDLHDVLAGLDRVVLVGWSLGALEALQYVHRHGSARVQGLMLVDSSVGEPPAPKSSDFLARLRADRAATVEDFVHAIFARPRPEAQLREIRDAALRMPLEDSIALLSDPQPREHWRAVALALRKPLAYVVTPQFREQARHLLAERPRTRIEVFEQAGHALFVDEAPRFNRLLADWIVTLR